MLRRRKFNSYLLAPTKRPINMVQRCLGGGKPKAAAGRLTPPHLEAGSEKADRPGVLLEAAQRAFQAAAALRGLGLLEALAKTATLASLHVPLPTSHLTGQNWGHS